MVNIRLQRLIYIIMEITVSIAERAEKVDSLTLLPWPGSPLHTHHAKPAQGQRIFFSLLIVCSAITRSTSLMHCFIIQQIIIITRSLLHIYFFFSLPPANIYLFYNRIYFHAFFIVPLSRSLFLRLSEAKANDDRLQRLGHTVFCHSALPPSIMYAYFVHSSFTMPVHAYHATYSYNIFIYYICII